MSVYTEAKKAAAQLARITKVAKHDILVICGSGLAPLAGKLDEQATEIPLSELGLTSPRVQGHGSSAYSARVGDKRVLILSGRVHLYEGVGVDAVVAGVRLAWAAGCNLIITTNAVGSLMKTAGPGSPVLIKDHINLTGANPLTGESGVLEGVSRFVDLSSAYSPRLRKYAIDTWGLQEGVLGALAGPSYETPAEIGMLRVLGADLIGMSVVCETIAARHLGMEVLGVSLVTNLAAGLAGPLSHTEVAHESALATDKMLEIISGCIYAA